MKFGKTEISEERGVKDGCAAGGNNCKSRTTPNGLTQTEKAKGSYTSLKRKLTFSIEARRSREPGGKSRSAQNLAAGKAK